MLIQERVQTDGIQGVRTHAVPCAISYTVPRREAGTGLDRAQSLHVSVQQTTPDSYSGCNTPHVPSQQRKRCAIILASRSGTGLHLRVVRDLDQVLQPASPSGGQGAGLQSEGSTGSRACASAHEQHHPRIRSSATGGHNTASVIT
jgi:hypothetical protein